MSQQTSNHSFDELARGLASGSISRGRVLRLMGAAVVGGTLASVRLLPTTVSATGSGVRRTLSAVAATATAARVPLVHLVGSCSATAHARCFAAVLDLLAAAPVRLVVQRKLILVNKSAVGTRALSLQSPTIVLPGSFVQISGVNSAPWRARGVAS